MVEQAFWILVSLAGIVPLYLPGLGQGKGRAAANWVGILVFSLPWFWLPFTTQPRFFGTLGIFAAAAGGAFFVFGSVLLALATRKIAAVVGPKAHGEPSRLMIEGPYGVVRHPAYSGMFVMMLGWSLIWGGVYATLLMPIIYLLFRFEALFEERQMEKKFGEAFKAYRRRVPAFFPTFVALPLGLVAFLIGASAALGWTPLS